MLFLTNQNVRSKTLPNISCHIIDRELLKKLIEYRWTTLFLAFFFFSSQTRQLSFLTGAAIFIFCFAEDFLLRMVWLNALNFDHIQWNGAAEASIFTETSGQTYITNKVELVSSACEDGVM